MTDTHQVRGEIAKHVQTENDRPPGSLIVWVCLGLSHQLYISSFSSSCSNVHIHVLILVSRDDQRTRLIP
jgi:hypothetical protein